MGIRSDINVPKLSVESLPCFLAKYLFQRSRAEYFQLEKNRSMTNCCIYVISLCVINYDFLPQKRSKSLRYIDSILIIMDMRI
jgi:hypothetical protein